MLSFEVKILASRLSDAIENYPQFLKEIEELQKADPSKNLKYLDWQLKQLSQREPLDEVIEMTRVFHARGAKLKKRDIYQYKTLGELREAIEELGRSSKEKRTGDAAELFQEERSKAKAYGSVVFDNDDVLVVKPKNVEESCYFGRNARWCISATQSENYYNQYTLQGNQHFYFIINKNLPLKHIFQKVAWQGAPREKPTFWRSDDQSFKKNDADFKRWEAVTPGLEEILEVVKAHLKMNPVSHLRMKVNEGDFTGLSIGDKRAYLQSEGASPKTLEKLAGDENEGIRTAIAERSDTPPAILVRLASDMDGSVRYAVARNPNTPAAALEHLTGDANVYLRETVARNQSAPAAILEKLSNDEDAGVRRIVAEHPNTPATVLERFADDKKWDVRFNVTWHPNSPPAALEKLASDKHEDIRLSIARRPNTPATVLDKLATDYSTEVREAVARNPNSPPAALEKLASDYNAVRTRLAVVNNPNSPLKILRQLAGDEDANVRLFVATNPNTPPATLEQLANDEHGDVRMAVLRNSSAPSAALERFAHDEDDYTRSVAAQNPNLPPAILEELANDAHWGVRLAVATSSNTPPATLELLLNNEDDDVIYNAAINNPNLPLAILERLAADEVAEAQRALRKRKLSARLDAVVETTARVRLSAQARLALEEAAAVMAARLMPVEEAMRILGIDRSVLADAAALKKAYRAASMKSHPDRGGSTALMQQVNEAYEVLSQHHEPSRAGEKSKAEEEAEYARDVARSLRTVQAALAKAFDPAAFTRHFANATGKEFTADVKQRVDDDYKKNPRAVNIDATWRSADGATVFSLHIYVNLADAIRVRMLGGGEDTLAFTVITRVEILHDSRKSKFQQRDWKFTSEARTLMDPEDLFPKAKIKKMIGGKEKARKFSARDMRLGMEKYLGAQIEDPWVQFPIGAPVPPIEGLSRFLQKFPNRFVVKMWRSVLMRTPIWDLYGVEGPVVPKQGRPKFQGPKHVSALESEALLDALVELQKEAEGMLDGAKLAEMAARAFEKARQKDE